MVKPDLAGADAYGTVAIRRRRLCDGGIDSPVRMTKQKTSDERPLAAVILAAGRSTRMQSDLPKVLHKVAGRTILGHLVDNLARLKPART